jgi:AraC-like DNA-binding protein
VTVAARSANLLSETARPDIGLVDVRAGTSVHAGTFVYAADDLVTGWHHHDLHQLEYAVRGLAHVQTADARHLLPPQQAVWIPAGLRHCTTLQGVRSIAVFFDPECFPDIDGRVHVVAATPVLREMIGYATRWPIDRPTSDETADLFFGTLSRLVCDHIDHDVPLCLPTSVHPVVEGAIEYTEAHLRDATCRDAAGAVGVSQRTLRRLFAQETGMSWQQYLQTSRVLRSMVLLAQAGRTVLDVAIAVGYASPSAFTRAFVQHTGERPADYRRRALQE